MFFLIFIYFKGCKCFVDSVVRLIEQYLKENNLMKTLIMLQVNNTIEVILVKIWMFNILYDVPIEVLYYTVSQKSSPFSFLWLLGQMLTDFNNSW